MTAPSVEALLRRVERALLRHLDGGAPRRIPADDSDSDVLLTAVRAALAAPKEEPPEPLISDQQYWLRRREAIIRALAIEGWEIWSDKDRVWLHPIRGASPIAEPPSPELEALGRDYAINFKTRDWNPALEEAGYHESEFPSGSLEIICAFVRREALEEAARVCEDYADAFDANPVGGLAYGRIAGAEDCAAAIRALIDAPSNPTTSSAQVPGSGA